MQQIEKAHGKLDYFVQSQKKKKCLCTTLRGQYLETLPKNKDQQRTGLNFLDGIFF